MGLWADFKKETGYDKSSDLKDRASLRDDYIKKAEEEGYSRDEALASLQKYNAFDKEKSESQHRKDVRSPQWEAERAKQAMSGYIQEAALGKTKVTPERALKVLQHEKDFPEMKDLTDEEVAKSVRDNPYRKNPIDLAFRESIIGQKLNYGALPEGAKPVAHEEINKERGEYEADIEKKSKAMRVLSRAEEMVGSLAGSPSTYVAGPALPALSAAKGIGTMAIPIYGMIQGAESAASDDYLGRDPAYAERILMGGATAYLGGKLGGKFGKGLGDIVEGAVAKKSSRIAPVAGSLAENTGRVAGMGAGGVIPQIGLDVARGQSEGSLDRASDNFLAQAIHGIPQVAGSLKTTRGIRGGVSDSYIKSLLDYDNSGKIKSPDVKTLTAETIKTLKSDMFAGSDAATKRKTTFGERSKAVAYKAMETIVDSNARALWTYNRLAKVERDAILQAYEKAGRKRKDVLDDMNKGNIPLPLAEQAANKLKALPTEEQKSVRNANQTMEGVYKDLSVTEGELLNKYATCRNLLNVKERHPDYILPKGYDVPGMQKFAAAVEGNPSFGTGDKNLFVSKANELFKINREILDRKFTAGELSPEDYNALVNSGDNLGIQHILPKEPRRFKGEKHIGSSSRDEIKFIGTGSSLPINMDVGAVTHNRLVREQMAHHINEAYRPLHDMAEQGTFGKILQPDQGPSNGNDIVTYIKDGKKVRIEVPDWFKASIEKMPVKNEFLRVISILSGSAPTRALAVGLNPEFAIANIARDFARYYNMMSAGDKIATPKEVLKVFINANPGVYTLKMGKAMAQTARDAWGQKGIFDEALQNNALRGRWTMDIANNPYVDEAHPVSKLYHKTQEVLGKPGAFSEDWLRVSAYKMLKDKGFTPERAGELVGGFLDFNRSGTITKVLDAVTPFFTVAVQAPRADIRMARNYPLSYASRIIWGMSIIGMIAAYKYRDGVGVTDQESPDQRTNFEMFPAWVDEKGRTTFVRIPLDQQDRFPAAISDSIVRVYKGLPIDWERVKKSAKDLALVSNIYGTAKGGGAGRAISAVVDDVNWDDYREQKLFTGPEPKKGARHDAFDPVKDSEALHILTSMLYNMTQGKVDVQPAMLGYAIDQYIPGSMITNTASTAVKAATGDTAKIDESNMPIVRKFFAKGDLEKPWRDSAAEPTKKKSLEQMHSYTERRKASQIKDIDEYIRFMTAWADREKNPAKMMNIYKEMNEGIKDRATGVDLRFKNFIRNNVDPGAYEDVGKEYERLHGRNPVNTDPNLLKRMYEERANEDSDEQ